MADFTEEHRKRLQEKYTSEEANDFLAKSLKTRAPYAHLLVDAIDQHFYSGSNGLPLRLPAPGRERVLVALLASRGATSALAIHVYLALAHGVELGEIEDILLLVGAYAGIDHFVAAQDVLRRTLTHLADLAKDDQAACSAADVITALARLS
ncbi:MAG: carboxymuconolactone decarboxylase family protein [Gammaproteobacteria bacterium]|nr:carboxymuconolactone decarboxylase family protein [Gammaproteobacteria bacterium]